jgi:prepilin-type N-terminal cleavage/methylation domain-containing protein
MTAQANSGFTLVELAVVLVVIAILGALLAPLLAGLTDIDRSSGTNIALKTVYQAIVGNPDTGNYGYLGDVGEYPATLTDLVRSRGLEGWNGPYLTDVHVENDMLLDSFGSPIDYYYRADPTAVTDQLAVISKGPDRGSSNTSATPNDWITYGGAPLPGNSGYGMDAANTDNIAHPRFTDHVGLLQYNNIGQLNLNVFNLDYSTNVSRYVPGCPNMYEIKVTSATRPSDTWGTAAVDTTPTYNPGGASFDLLQGNYRVQLRLRYPPNGVYYDEVVPIAAGAVQNKTIYVPGPDSTVTPNSTLNVLNNYSFGITLYDASGTSIGTATGSGGMALGLNVRGCSQVIVKNTTTQTLVDSFVMPIGITYNKIYDPVSYTYTVTNSSGTYRYLFVYRNNVLIGEVSGWGKQKVKVFTGLHAADQILIKDRTGNAPHGLVSITGDDADTF